MILSPAIVNVVRTRSCAALLALLSLSLAKRAEAQRVDGAPWRPDLSVDPNALPYVEGTLVPGHGRWNFGLTVDYAHDTLRLSRGGVVSSVLGHQLTAIATTQVGLGAHSAIALQVPVVLYQGGASATETRVPAPSTAGIGDLRLLLRWSSRAERDVAVGRGVTAAQAHQRQTEQREGLGVGLNLAGTVPLGDERGYIGAGAPTVHAFGVVDFRLARIVGAVSLGYRFRFDGQWPSQPTLCIDATAASCLLDVPLRDQITFGVAVRQPLEGLLALAFLGFAPRLASATILSGYYAATWVTIQGAIDARDPFASQRSSPTEMAAGLQSTIGEWTFSAGAAFPLTSAPGTAAPRVIAQAQWAPRFIDEDRDGLRDDPSVDHCVGLAEDFDGFEDHDGCPEDNDHDAIPDEEDRCPFVDEDEDGFEDDDGCPDPDNDRDGVNDTDDRCPDTPAGDHPDPQRRGCPDEDLDHDGVANPQDQCPDTAVGANADPERPGCPVPDSDGDGVFDHEDRCPREANPANATTRYPGCPDADPDGDGLVGDADRCPTEAETFNGPAPFDGCPSPATARPLASRRVLVTEPTTPGAVATLELSVPLAFLPNDQLAPAARPLVAELAVAIRRVALRRAIVERPNTPPRAQRLQVAVSGTWTRPTTDAARADRRRDALLTALRALGVTPEMAAPTASVERPARLQRGMGFTVTIVP